MSENFVLKWRKFTDSKQVDAKVEQWGEIDRDLIRISWVALWYPVTEGNFRSGSTVYVLHEIAAIGLICNLATQVCMQMRMGTEKVGLILSNKCSDGPGHPEKS